MQILPHLYIANTTDRGRGVFTAKAITKGEIIEICPLIILSEKDKKIIHQTHLHDYYFDWGETEKECAIALGYGSIYNHDTNPNADYFMNHEDQSITVECIQDIEAGSEITFMYVHKKEDESKLWFNVN